MASIGDRLDALESVLSASMNLQDRITNLEKQLQTMTDLLSGGEKRYQYLLTLPEGRCKAIDENTASITDSLDDFNKVMKENGDPVDSKTSELANRIKAMESAIGISS